MTSRGRPAALVAVAAAVLLAHLWLADGALPDSRLGDGTSPAPKRIEVAFVRELAPSAVAPAPPVVRRRAPRPLAAPAPAASAPEAEPPPEPQSEPPPEATAPAADPPVDDEPLAAAAAPAAEASAAEAEPVVADGPPDAASASLAAASAPAPVAFEWPPSTRLSYTLTGDYRGPVHGQAQVEWLRSGTRYQVHLDVTIGPPFAPLVTRRMSSDGDLGEQGLQPRRYDEETRVVLREPRRATIRFEPDRVLLADREVPAPAGVQDSASQFVQLTWMFTLDPSLLRAGHQIELPLALPRRVGRWVYDVIGEESVQTPVGPVATWKLRPRAESVRPGELSVEVWFAPALQYLPVRIKIRQDPEVWVDLLVDRLPQQAAPER